VARDDPDRLLRNIGLRIVELREKRGWSREAFAERLQISTRYLGRLEAGRQNLTIHRLAWLGDALGVRVIDLLATAGIEAIPVGRPRLSASKPRHR
jgi:transcriptional regulator with XRE-family HTH domain